jgi:parvulin-like peptidyl-prolyl isomerase
MKRIIFISVLVVLASTGSAQKKTVAQIKKEIQSSQNPVAYVRDTLKKKYRFDTVIVTRINNFHGIADSLAYYGQVRKVYGPYDKGKILVQVLGKLPNTFYRVGQIYIDTAIFKRQFADSMANSIIKRISAGSTTFEQMAQTYSMGGEDVLKGDIGWVAQGVLIPEIESEIKKHKKGEIFKVWTRAGVHIIRKTENPKQDTGFALMMRVFL